MQPYLIQPLGNNIDTVCHWILQIAPEQDPHRAKIKTENRYDTEQPRMFTVQGETEMRMENK